MLQELDSIGAARAAAATSLHAAYVRIAAEARKAKANKAAADMPGLLAQAQAAHSATFKGI